MLFGFIVRRDSHIDLSRVDHAKHDVLEFLKRKTVFDMALETSLRIGGVDEFQIRVTRRPVISPPAKSTSAGDLMTRRGR